MFSETFGASRGVVSGEETVTPEWEVIWWLHVLHFVSLDLLGTNSVQTQPIVSFGDPVQAIGVSVDGVAEMVRGMEAGWKLGLCVVGNVLGEGWSEWIR